MRTREFPDFGGMTIKTLREYIKENELEMPEGINTRSSKEETINAIHGVLGIRPLDFNDNEPIKNDDNEPDNEPDNEDDVKEIKTANSGRPLLRYAFTLENIDVRTDRCCELVIKGNKVIEESVVAQDHPPIVRVKLRRKMEERKEQIGK